MLPAFIFLGIIAGLFMGMLGIGGGIIIVPGLIYLAGFSGPKAVGTSIAVLLPPIGIAAAIEYYRHGNVDIKAALIIALTVMCTAWIAAHYSKYVPDAYVKIVFGVSIISIGIYMVVSNVNRLFA
ncbi:MAG: sulfite exporter TauE/SafE family protein [Deltaproteobacteria bacterium]|nr:sulfite exporter TauE/SafE family protein [Deltaproteobacteria bacterium]